MIELLFSDSAAGSLKVAKCKGKYLGGVGVKITIDSEGNQRTERFSPEAFKGPFVGGSSADVLPIWLNADIGDISNMTDWSSRMKILRDVSNIHDFMDEEWVLKQELKAHKGLQKLLEMAAGGEHIRIWWSDSPGETCGFFWTMDLLKDSACKVTSVKVPNITLDFQGKMFASATGALAPAQFAEMLAFEREIAPENRKAIADRWQELVKENAPIRAVINGTLCSVDIDFYDYILRRNFPASETPIAHVISNSLTNGPGGVGDWLYALRLQHFISIGELTVIKTNKDFYRSTIIKA